MRGHGVLIVPIGRDRRNLHAWFTVRRNGADRQWGEN
jgi:hypothetical protein